MVNIFNNKDNINNNNNNNNNCCYINLPLILDHK